MLIKWRDVLQFSAYKPSTEHSLITVTSSKVRRSVSSVFVYFVRFTLHVSRSGMFVQYLYYSSRALFFLPAWYVSPF